MRKIFAFLLTFLVAGMLLPVAAQEEENTRMPINIGVYGGLNINMHNPAIDYGILAIDNSYYYNRTFDQNTTDLGFNAGIIGNFPITDIFTISGRIGFNQMNGFFENQHDFIDRSNNTLKFRDEMEASLSYVEISPILQLHNLLPLKPLYFLAGLEIGIPVINEYNFVQNSIVPNNYFNGQSTYEVLQSTEIEEANTRFAVAVGAGYTFTLAKNIFLSPEVSFRFPFNSVSNFDGVDESMVEPSGIDLSNWTVPQIRAGINLTFGLGGDEEPEPVITESTIDVGFAAVQYYDNEGNPHPANRIKVEQVQYSELFPLLPHVFYEPGEEQPDPEEQDLTGSRQVSEFTIETLEPDAMEINQNTLDIIGRRMQKFDNATLTITGTNDTKNRGENLQTARERAQWAKQYLVDNYNIDERRITVEARNLPEEPSTMNDPEGVAENRRITFTSNRKEILQPILIERDRQTLSDPGMIEFVPNVTSTDTLTSWEMEISQKGKVLRKFSGENEPETMQWVILPNELAASEIPVEYTLKASNNKGKRDFESGSIPVDYVSYTREKTEDTPDKSVAKYSLVVFEFDSPVISDFDKDVIRKHIIPAIKYNSTVQIYGYTDRIGEEDYNKKLAMQRAENVRDFLKSQAKAAKYEVYGLGENVKLFENDSPVGRQLSRTVQVYITTPKE